MVAVSHSAAQLLNLSADDISSKEFIEIFSGQKIPKDGHHIAQVYAGHQFGHYVPQLGDGRSIFVGEVKNNLNESWDIHLKGAGQTPFSRMGDGRAVLRSTIREFLASEAMAALNIPTTRALCIIATTDSVYREQQETGAIMTRLAKSHIRFGNFEYLFHQQKHEELTKLMQFCLKYYYPESLAAKNPIADMLKSIVVKTAQLIAQWQTVGFCHGVMNTDNMSIIGDTLDYGPFAFMDDYQPSYICNHSDHTGRYAFNQQPTIGLWNLNALAYCFSTHLTVDEIQLALEQYEVELVRTYQNIMQKKLGFTQWNKAENELLSQYLLIMANNKSDYCSSFRLLEHVFIDDSTNQQCQPLLDLHGKSAEFVLWLTQYRQILKLQSIACDERIVGQTAINPKYILRNYLAEYAIKQAQLGDFNEIAQLNNVLSAPFSKQSEYDNYAKKTPESGKNMEISCSS